MKTNSKVFVGESINNKEYLDAHIDKVKKNIDSYFIEREELKNKLKIDKSLFYSSKRKNKLFTFFSNKESIYKNNIDKNTMEISKLEEKLWEEEKVLSIFLDKKNKINKNNAFSKTNILLDKVSFLIQNSKFEFAEKYLNEVKFLTYTSIKLGRYPYPDKDKSILLGYLGLKKYKVLDDLLDSSRENLIHKYYKPQLRGYINYGGIRPLVGGEEEKKRKVFSGINIEKKRLSARYYFFRGLLLYPDDSAIELFEESVEYIEKDNKSYLFLGRIFFKNRNYKKALNCFEKFDDKSFFKCEDNYQYTIAKFYNSNNKSDYKNVLNSLLHFKKLCKINDSQFNYYLIRSFYHCNDFKGAKEFIYEEDPIFENDDSYNKYDFYKERGLIKYYFSDNKGSIEDLTIAISINSTYYLYYCRGLSYKKLSNNKNALLDFNKAIDLKKDYYLAIFERGNVKGFLGDKRGALKDLNKVIEFEPSKREVLYQRGILKYHLNDKDGACEDWSKAGELGYFEAYEQIQKHCD